MTRARITVERTVTKGERAMFYSIRVLDHDDCNIATLDDVRGKREALKDARDMLAEAIANDPSTVQKVEVLDDNELVVWDAFPDAQAQE